MRLLFVADFFADQVAGGGELNNEELINILIDKGVSVKKTQSHVTTLALIEGHEFDAFIVSNFVNLPIVCREALYDKKYIIYEHDHKYLRSRNPATYPDFKAPTGEVINREFYKNAASVLCQSGFHRDIVYKNLGLDNIISLGGNLWGERVLDLVRLYASKEKMDKHSIMDSPILHKNTQAARAYCVHKKLDFDLIPSLPYSDFLDRLSNNNSLVFFPKTPETLSRIVVEARMMGMKVTTNNLVGATREEWFKLKGPELIDIMVDKRETISNMIIKALK